MYFVVDSVTLVVAFDRGYFGYLEHDFPDVKILEFCLKTEYFYKVPH
jgi:hypothetical protein